MSELLLGCGTDRRKLFGAPGKTLEWTDLVTLDKNLVCKPNIWCDLDNEVWECVAYTERAAECMVNGALKPDQFDEVHAYEILEHLGRQGFASDFFGTFRNIHRILVPGGLLFGSCPSRHSPWAWGDPSNRRIISQESLLFLSQEHIATHRKHGTSMSDFSALWNLDFKVFASGDNHAFHQFALQKV